VNHASARDKLSRLKGKDEGGRMKDESVALEDERLKLS
jgi:hypothetical protein